MSFKVWIHIEKDDEEEASEPRFAGEYDSLGDAVAVADALESHAATLDEVDEDFSEDDDDDDDDDDELE